MGSADRLRRRAMLDFMMIDFMINFLVNLGFAALGPNLARFPIERNGLLDAK
jgi:hypothetical protein